MSGLFVTNQSGKISLSWVFAIVFAIGFAGSGYYNYVQSQQAIEDHNLLQGQITDLTYQLKKDASASAAPSPTPTPLATPEVTTTPIATPAVQGTATISIAQFGIRLTATDPVADLTYDMAPSGAYQVAALSTRALVSKYSACKPSASNTALGMIVQKKTGLSSTGKLIKQQGIYNYFYIAPVGYCAGDQAGRDALAAARAAVKNAVLPTLTN